MRLRTGSSYHLKDAIPLLLVFIVLNEKSAIIPIVFLSVQYLASLWLYTIVFLLVLRSLMIDFHKFNYAVSWYGIFLLLLWDLLKFPNLQVYSFCQPWDIFSHKFFLCLFSSTLCSFFLGL